MFSEIALVLISFFAFLQDIRMHKIKNWYVLCVLLLGILYQFMNGNGLYGLIGAAFGMVLYPLFMLRFMGAGDVKMFCALGAWAAFPAIVKLMAICILTNGVVAFLVMLIRKNGVKTFRNFWLWLKTCLMIRGYVPMAEEADQSDKYPYMAGVFLGIMIFCFAGGRL